MSAPEMLTPDWVMLGIPNADGTVTLIASKELTYAELEGERDKEPDEFWPPSYRYVPPPEMRYHVRADMKTFVMIAAPDYPAAFRHLFRQWTPESAQRQQLPASMPSLEQ